MKVIVANPGTGVYILETVNAYNDADYLYRYYTTFVSNKNVPFYNSINNPKIKKELDRRAISQNLIEKTSTKAFAEILRTISSRFFNEKTTDLIYEWSEYSFDRWVASKLDSSIDIVHCYEHSSLETIKKAKKLGIFVVYEQPSQHHSFLTPILEEQFKLNPALGTSTSSLLVNKKSEVRNMRRNEELMLADLIVCNSSFTKRTLLTANIPDSKINVVPLGFPTTKHRVSSNKKNNRLRFIYAGTSNIRKGIHILLDVWKQNFSNRDDIELFIIGKFDLPESYRYTDIDNLHFVNSVPREELLENFYDADVLILPTLADGFGMVITEAMSRGVCVMCTENSAGPDIITHEKDGLIFKANSRGSIFEIIQTWSTRNDEISLMGKAAFETAKKYQWSDFRKNLIDSITKSFNERK